MRSFSKLMEVNQLRRAKDTGEKIVIRREVDVEIKAAEGDASSFDFVISTASVDRYGDTIAQDGWNLKAFKKSPVVLWMHNGNIPPIAKASHVRVEDGKLKARATFDMKDEFAAEIARKISEGFIRATSVGFVPMKYAFVDEPERRFGIDFQEQELLEFSLVSVPANAEALIDGKVADVTHQSTDEWSKVFERLIEASRQREFLVPPSISVDLARRKLELAKLRAA